MGQIFWTHRDSGGTQFNYSEVAGNSAAGGNFERLLCRPPDSVRRRIETRYSARRRYGGQHLEGVLAGHRGENSGENRFRNEKVNA